MSNWPPMQQQGGSEPVPAQPLGYSTSNYGRAPGLITAIGVVSIVVASLGILVNGLVGLWSLAAMSMMGAVSARTTATITSVNAGPVASPYAIPSVKRQIVTEALSKLQPLSPLRQRHLDVLLKEEGQRVLSLPEASITAQRITQNVSRSGQQEGETWYLMGNGRVIVSDKEARFEPLDPNGETLTASATTASSAEELAKATIARVEALSGKKLNPAQAKSLTKELADPNQTILSTNQTTSVTEINGAYAQPDGSMMLWMPGQTVTISATGNLQKTEFGMGPAASIPPAAKRAAVVGVIDSMASLLLAIFLLVAGIMTLRQSSHGARLHWGYVALKIPLVLASVGYWVWQISNLTSGRLAAMSVFAAIVMSVGLIYPLVLIFALSTRTARGYYSTSGTV